MHCKHYTEVVRTYTETNIKALEEFEAVNTLAYFLAEASEYMI